MDQENHENVQSENVLESVINADYFPEAEDVPMVEVNDEQRLASENVNALTVNANMNSDRENDDSNDDPTFLPSSKSESSDDDVNGDDGVDGDDGIDGDNGVDEVQVEKSSAIGKAITRKRN